MKLNGTSKLKLFFNVIMAVASPSFCVERLVAGPDAGLTDSSHADHLVSQVLQVVQNCSRCVGRDPLLTDREKISRLEVRT